MTVQEMFQKICNDDKMFYAITGGSKAAESDFKKAAFEIIPQESSLVYILGVYKDILAYDGCFASYTAYERKDILAADTSVDDDIIYKIKGMANGRAVLSRENVKQVHELFPVAKSYSILLTPWKEIMGGTVILLHDAPAECESEMVRLASSIFDEMTFFGSEEELEKERKELTDREEVVEQIRKLPKEEQDKHFIPAEKVFSDLRHKYNIPEPTPEEKAIREKQREKEMSIFRKYCILNRIAEYQDQKIIQKKLKELEKT